MIRLLQHDSSIPREEDGAVRFDDFMGEVKAKFDGTSHLSINAWIFFLAKGGAPKKRFQHCLNPLPNTSCISEQFRDKSGGNLVELALQDNVLLLEDFTEYIYHVGNISEI